MGEIDTHLNYLMNKVLTKYGRSPRIDFYGDQWRIWPHGWHTHGFGTISSLAGHGDTLEAAAHCLLNAQKVYEGDWCGEGCPEYDDFDL